MGLSAAKNRLRCCNLLIRLKMSNPCDESSRPHLNLSVIFSYVIVGSLSARDSWECQTLLESSRRSYWTSSKQYSRRDGFRRMEQTWASIPQIRCTSLMLSRLATDDTERTKFHSGKPQYETWRRPHRDQRISQRPDNKTNRECKDDYASISIHRVNSAGSIDAWMVIALGPYIRASIALGTTAHARKDVRELLQQSLNTSDVLKVRLSLNEHVRLFHIHDIGKTDLS